MDELELLNTILNRLDLIYSLNLVTVSVLSAIGVVYLLYCALRKFF